jgi:murein DD-endopeptidase MepM/ murein hydrolase activator NlpD
MGREAQRLRRVGRGVVGAFLLLCVLSFGEEYAAARPLGGPAAPPRPARWASLAASAGPGAPEEPGGSVTPGAAEPSAGRGTPAKSNSGKWRWPVDGLPRVVRRFDPPANPYGPGHRGVDLAAEPGAVVRSAGAGVVWFAGQVGGVGVVSVKHADGRRTTYEPLHPMVRAGSVVTAGTMLGTLGLGHPGCPAVTCLHWGLIEGDAYRDPLLLLMPARVRLYPLDAGQLAPS